MFDRVKQFDHPVLFFSGGLDSTLLLALLREEDIRCDIVTVGREHWTKQQKQRTDALIRDWGLKIFSYPPAGISFLGDGEQISVASDYAIGGSVVPILQDVIPGDRCIAELDGMRMYNPPFEWDCVLVGSRKADRHYVLENVAPDREWKVGNATFIAPLYDWTREEVQEALKAMGLPSEEVDDYADSGNLVLCDRCLRATESIKCPIDGSMIEPQGAYLKLNLTEFRKRFESEVL